jgi:tetratricopeptide (TPR) repeat protein
MMASRSPLSARGAVLALSLLLAREAVADSATLASYERSAAAFADGLALAERGLDEEASRSYQEAIGLDAGFVEAMVNLARIRLRQGDPERAREWLDRALRLAPAYPPVHAVRGLVARERGDLQEALRAFSRARSLDPENAEVLANLGATLFELGLDEDARGVLEEARRRAPVRPEPVLTLALVWERKGDRGRAAFFYGQFLSLVGTDDPARALAEARLRALEAISLKTATPTSETVSEVNE